MLSHLPSSKPENSPGPVICQRLAGPLSLKIISISQAAEPQESRVRISLAELTGIQRGFLAITRSFEGTEVWQGREQPCPLGDVELGVDVTLSLQVTSL